MRFLRYALIAVMLAAVSVAQDTPRVGTPPSAPVEVMDVPVAVEWLNEDGSPPAGGSVAMAVQVFEAGEWADYTTEALTRDGHMQLWEIPSHDYSGDTYSKTLQLPEAKYRVAASGASSRDETIAALGPATAWRVLDVLGQIGTAPRGGRPVRCTVASGDDDGDPITFDFVWELTLDGVWAEQFRTEGVAGELQADGLYIAANQTEVNVTKGQEWRCTVVAVDEDGRSEPLVGAFRAVGNKPNLKSMRFETVE